MIDAMPDGEFDRWVKAVDVLKLFPDRPRDTATKALAVRMIQGRLKTGAEEARIHGMPYLRHCFLHPAVWSGWAHDLDNDFWLTGDTTVPWGIDDDYELSPTGKQLFDVRFDPEGLRQMGATGLPAAPSADQSTGVGEGPRPAVSQADLDRWAVVFLGVHGESVTEALALQSARAMFPDRAVSRDRVRALLPARKPGRPTNRGKIGE